MRSSPSSADFVGLIVVLAFLATIAALVVPDGSDAEPSTFEAHALVSP